MDSRLFHLDNHYATVTICRHGVMITKELVECRIIHEHLSLHNFQRKRTLHVIRTSLSSETLQKIVLGGSITVVALEVSSVLSTFKNQITEVVLNRSYIPYITFNVN